MSEATMVGRGVTPRDAAAVARFAEDTMHDQIRIPPDRRREVRVGVGRQPEVPLVHGVVARLLHRAQHQERDRLLFRGTAHPLDQLLEIARADL